MRAKSQIRHLAGSAWLHVVLLALAILNISAALAEGGRDAPSPAGSNELFFVVNAGLNDAWFDPSTPGQGFFITVYRDQGTIFLGWFTFDTERPPAGVESVLGDPGARWLTASGPYSDEIATLEVELTRGGVFGANSPAPGQESYGMIELEFIDCLEAIVRYDIPSLELAGEITITRIAVDNVLRCLAEQPQ